MKKEFEKRRFSPESAEDSDRFEGLIEGRNPIIEAIRAKRPIDKVYIAKGETDSALNRIAAMAKNAGAVVVETDRRRLDAMSQTGAHQGVVALASVKEYSTIDDIFAAAEEKGEAPFIIVCDEISDVHNLGAIIRTADASGAHGVIIPKRRSAGLTAVIGKTSAGAVEYVPVARVANITSALDELKKRGVWVYGTAADGDNDIWGTDFKGSVAIVIGSEGSGMTRLVRESCDFTVSIPMVGGVSSLNASASAAILMYEVMRQRKNR